MMCKFLRLVMVLGFSARGRLHIAVPRALDVTQEELLTSLQKFARELQEIEKEAWHLWFSAEPCAWHVQQMCFKSFNMLQLSEVSFISGAVVCSIMACG